MRSTLTSSARRREVSWPCAAAVRISAQIVIQVVHKRLRFRVAQADVEFQKLGSVSGQHQPGIQESGEARRVDRGPEIGPEFRLSRHR